MHSARFYLPIFIALAAAGCARQQQQQAYMIDPATGRGVPAVMLQQPSAPQAYAQQPQYVRPSVPPPVVQPAPSGERGLFTSQQDGPPSYLSLIHISEPTRQ